MSNVYAIHPPKSDLILLYEVVDENGVPEWGGESPEKAFDWLDNSITASRILVSAWDSDEEDAQLVGQSIDITAIVMAGAK